MLLILFRNKMISPSLIQSAYPFVDPAGAMEEVAYPFIVSYAAEMLVGAVCQCSVHQNDPTQL